MPFRLLFAVSLHILLAFPAVAFDLQGHRGARGLMPENTLPAFAGALSIGVTTLELDVVISKDGVVVASHNTILDGDLARDEDGKWLETEPLIKDLSFAELQMFDLGRLNPKSRSAQRFPDQQAVDGTRIPSLAQVFELAKKAGNETVRFNIETKINPVKPDETVSPEQFAKAVISVVQEYRMESRASIQSFDWRTLLVVQKNAPNIETVYLSAQQRWMDTINSKSGDWTAGFKVSDHSDSVPVMVQAAGGKVWSPFYGDITKELVEAAHNIGLKVIPWTVNDAETMKAMIGLNVDGLISDFPDVLRKVAIEMKLSVPAPTPVTP